MATVSESVELLTLRQFTDDLTTVIAADPLKVANKLFEKKLISDGAHRSVIQEHAKEKQVKASELMLHVRDQVQHDSRVFDEFIEILIECVPFQSLANKIRKAVSKNKEELRQKKSCTQTNDIEVEKSSYLSSL